MSVSTEKPWSGDPNAPQIPFSLYIEEKEDFAGFLMGAISYGTLTHPPAPVFTLIYPSH